VSRLYDRIRAQGTRAVTAADLLTHSAEQSELRAQFAEEVRARGLEPTTDALDAELRKALARGAQAKALAPPLGAGPDALPSMPIVVADNVARYLADFGPDPDADLSDLVSTVVPPFAEMWIDVQHAPNKIGMNAWGIHFVRDQDPGTSIPREPSSAWVVNATIYGEWKKNDPVGPVAKFGLPLNNEGRLREGDEQGRGAILGRVVEIAGMTEGELHSLTDWFTSPTLGAGLLAISFMHCKNVDVREVDPPRALAKKRRKKHGIPPTRYYVLDIAPMTSILTSVGHANETGLRNALHICRGHFKEYGPEAPLFGRHTGKYWWADQRRGDKSRGEIDKDYRIRIDDEGLGQPWHPADEHAEIASATESTGRDPDLAGRGKRAHNKTVNALAEAVRSAGYEPQEPKPSEPRYDLAWDDGNAIWVAEVKSLTPANEQRQLDKALGQVLRYRHHLDGGTKPVKAVIATENTARR
jgi:hypothetical protein